MWPKVQNNLTAFIFLISLAYSVAANIPKGSYRQTVEAHFKERIYYYDENGLLVVNGSVPGSSGPIVLDFKYYYHSCANNVYFTMLFKADLSKAGENGACPEGITICYEGQLFGEYMNSDYSVENVKGDENKLLNSCANANDGAYNARGFNVAVVTFPGLRSDLIHVDGKQLTGVKKDVFHFFVITSSFFKQSYYFIAPDDGVLVLQLGGRKSLFVKIMNTGGEELVPVTFRYKNKNHGTKSIGGPPDVKNGQNRWQEHAGLWMLYLDFKTEFRAWQVLSVMNPPQQCAMTVQIRGNRIGVCRSFFEDIAVTEGVDANMNLVYTSEVGTIQKQQYGQEDMKEIATRLIRAEMEGRTSKSSKDLEEDKTTTTEDAIEQIKNKTKKVTEKNEFKADFGLDWNSNPLEGLSNQLTKYSDRNYGTKINEKVALTGGGDGGGGMGGKAGIEGHYSETDTKHTTDQEIEKNRQIERKRERMFSKLTKSHTMMEKFKNTVGAAQSLSESEFLSTTSAFETREMVDIRISGIPRNTKVIIRQLMFECDGNVVKLPFIFLTDGKEELKLTQTALGGKISMPLNPSWVNQTSGMDADKVEFKSLIELEKRGEIEEQNQIYSPQREPKENGNLDKSQTMAVNYEDLKEQEADDQQEMEEMIDNMQ